MFHGKTHYKWPFSIAMLNYQRVDSPNSGCFLWIFHLRWHQVVDDLRLFARIGDGEGGLLPHAELRVARHDGEPGVFWGHSGGEESWGIWKHLETNGQFGKTFLENLGILEKCGNMWKERKEKLVKFSQIMRSHLLLVAICWMKHE